MATIFPQNKLTELPNVMQFKRMFMFCLKDWKGGAGPPAPSLLFTPLNTMSALRSDIFSSCCRLTQLSPLAETANAAAAVACNG